MQEDAAISVPSASSSSEAATIAPLAITADLAAISSSQLATIHSHQNAEGISEDVERASSSKSEENWGPINSEEGWYEEEIAPGNAEENDVVELLEVEDDVDVVDVDECPICMRPLAHSPSAIALQCHASIEHTFCTSCLKQWLLDEGHKCPTCRAEVSAAVRARLGIGTLATVHQLQNLGFHLASNTMQQLMPGLDFCTETLQVCAQEHSLISLISEPSVGVLQAIGVSAAQLSFKPYLDHMVQSPHGAITQRITAICAINADGFRIHRTSVDADSCHAIRNELQDAIFCNTCPLWLGPTGAEVPAKVLGHETMLKPDDCWTHAAF